VIYALVIIAGYFIGSFPTGVVLTKRKYGLDVREMGSGNIGATNVTRVFGWYAGALVFLVDFLKGFVPLYFLSRYYPENHTLLALGAAALVLGHCYSCFLKFNGGKGVATSFGCLALVVPWCALFCALTYGLLLATTKISAVGSLGGLVTALIYLAVMQPPLSITYLVMGITLIVVWRHKENIRRLRETIRLRKTRS
jgi:acyl phosphate:glycerol-3-phosphate acyltransferase